MNKSVRLTLIALTCAVGVAACSKKQEVKPAPPPPPPPAPTETAPAQPTGYTPADLNSDPCLRQRVVYFDFDQSTIKPEFQQIIACHAQYLQDRPSAQVRLEGNTDERGSREYNLGLGERRSKAVEAALEAHGASASQITVISYGEERPTCRQHNESCWSKNRRVNIVYTSK
ncbi:MAG TPA: peptidoglycan-associated lipoprotein Pal [Oleiagrimonas sp.]|nr:peptidoglycan-associated lipoprotein Pal [Oleiagrimonas sp.]